MTLHTKAATDDILDIFNQPLRNIGTLSNQFDSAGESELEDDDYTSGGESTGTGAISGASEFGDDEVETKRTLNPNALDNGEIGAQSLPAHEGSVSERDSSWSDFTMSKHVPVTGHDISAAEGPTVDGDPVICEDFLSRPSEVLLTPTENTFSDLPERPKFIPIPPEDYEPPTRPYRDPSQVAQNRLPFMTPIVEKTESSIGLPAMREEKDYFNSKTPSRQHGDGSGLAKTMLSSPFSQAALDVESDPLASQSSAKEEADDDKPHCHTHFSRKRPLPKPIEEIESDLLGDLSQVQHEVDESNISDFDHMPRKRAFSRIVHESEPNRLIDLSLDTDIVQECEFSHQQSLSQNGPIFDIISETESDLSGNTEKRSVQNQLSKQQTSQQPTIRDTCCNPIDSSIKDTILEKLEPALSSYPGYHDYRPECCNKATEIRKFVKALNKKGRRGSSDKTTTSVVMPPTIKFLNEGSKVYAVKRQLGEGAFAPVYLGESVDHELEEDSDLLSKSLSSAHSQLVAIKCEDPPTAWEFFIMTTIHSRLDVSSRALDSILVPHEMHLFADEGYLIEQYLEQGTLLDFLNVARADSSSGVIDESMAMFFAVELLRTVEALHEIGILHGDLKADNCLVRLRPTPASEDWDPDYHRDGGDGWASKGLVLIDFGRGIDMRQFTSNVQFIADWKTNKQDCPEMRETRPWTWQIDYFGLAGVIHSLLFGKYLEDVAVDASALKIVGGVDSVGSNDETVAIKTQREKQWKIKEPLKRYWQTELWGGLFELLLNPTKHVEGEEGGKMPVMKGLRACREGMEEWLELEAGRKGLKASLKKLEEKIKQRKK